MITHDIQPGTQEWHAHRARFLRNASDSPAMLGCNPSETRNQLLHRLWCGLHKVFSDFVQANVIDEGHRGEALARPLAELIIGEPLYAMVGSDGPMSASFDGITMDEATTWEHKSINGALRDVLPAEGVGGPEIGAALPLLYRAQMESHFAVSGAGRELFTASKWGEDDALIEARHCWYEPDMALRAQIIAGWAQFEEDLANYEQPVDAPVAVAAPVERLPAVSIQTSGALAVVSNLNALIPRAREYVAAIPTKPETDQEFADCDAAVKRLKEVEEALDAAVANALASVGDIEAMQRAAADLKAILRPARLGTQKLVEARKTLIRETQVQRGRISLADHLDSLNKRLGRPLMPAVFVDFAAVIKGIKTIESLRNAIDTELARAKIDASACADRIDGSLKLLRAAGSPILFPDSATLVLKAPDDLAAVIAQRLAAEAARLETERARIRAEELASIESDAEAKCAAEAAEAAEAAKPVSQPTSMAPLDPPPVIPTAVAPIAAESSRRATMNLGQINSLLGFNLTAAFLIETIGITSAGKDKAAILFDASAWPEIKKRLINYIEQRNG